MPTTIIERCTLVHGSAQHERSSADRFFMLVAIILLLLLPFYTMYLYDSLSSRVYLDDWSRPRSRRRPRRPLNDGLFPRSSRRYPPTRRHFEDYVELEPDAPSTAESQAAQQPDTHERQGAATTGRAHMRDDFDHEDAPANIQEGQNEALPNDIGSSDSAAAGSLPPGAWRHPSPSAFRQWPGSAEDGYTT